MSKSKGGAAAEKQPMNPKSTSFEWGGPMGALGIMLGLPFGVFALNAICGDSDCQIGSGLEMMPDVAAKEWQKLLAEGPLVFGIVTAWLVFHCVFYLLPIGQRVPGTLLRNGQRLTYNINALHVWFICHGALLALYLTQPQNPYFAYVTENFMIFACVAGVISIVSAILLYVLSFRGPHVLTALGGNSGNAIYDCYVGRELNPRLGQLDFKFVMELRPGLIGWSMLNWIFVLQSVQAGTFTIAIALCALFQSYYVLEALWFEAGNLTMMDLTEDGFGFMLMFGDIGWVPFTYCLQCKYMLYNPQHHDALFLAGVILLKCVGYMFFRGANSQKNAFRTDPKSPKVAHLKVMKTSAGKSLIISGFWGICRHPNYVGDLCMALSWSMLTGTSAIIPYFYPIYFGVLLVHRQLRDEHFMKKKYGEEDWKRYCEHVPYRMIPYVY